MSFEIKKDPTRVCILATGQSWDLGPIETEKTIYALNDYVKIEKYGVKPDILFMLDILDEKPGVVAEDNLGDMVKRINQMKVPFVGPYKYEEIPLSEAFPLKECAEKFGYPYFSNTIGYMIAYALLKGAKEIELFGVNQAGSHEYVEERPSVEYWLGIAVGMGVKVTINGANSQLLKYKGNVSPTGMLYGYRRTYEQVMQIEQKFGKPIVIKLSEPPANVQRVIQKRKIN
jgi:hypothetical protein